MIANETTIHQSSDEVNVRNYRQLYNDKKTQLYTVSYKWSSHEKKMEQFNCEN